ncbi:hypothetical protein [Vreelandella aquamarina]|uniref:Uncharacterized protein n=1 Tax=Vreelandella aquamarina TaxID=77097 RepID=A0A1H8MI05_9GAMM|nr:hypothetical protein [Halomonas aquamarina]SEO16894.1 hypothetical protein SAMN04490369_105019 [Halomonas aquamarina]
MPGELSVLLKSLRGGEDSFEVVEYDDKKNSSDTSKIFEMQRKKDVTGLVDFWRKKSEEKFFELTHPERNVKTRAVYSLQHFMSNYVFMLDRYGGNPWVMAQSSFLIDMAITDKVIYKNYFVDERTILPHICKLSEVNLDDFEYDFADFGFVLSNARPYHHFYDQLKFFCALPDRKCISTKSSFFFGSDACRAKNGQKVFLFPNAVGNSHLNQKESSVVRSLNEAMELSVYREALNLRKVEADPSSECDLVLWFGVTGQKRSWLEQVDGCVNIVKSFKPYFDKIFVYVDGMTAMQGSRINNKEDEAVFREIDRGVAGIGGVTAQSLIGWDYREKILCCNSVDFFIANAGSGCMVPLRFVKKPGVLHSNTKLFTFPDEYPSYVKRVSNYYVEDVFNGKNSVAMHVSYHIPWQHVFNLAADVVREIKNIEVKKLEVPKLGDDEIHNSEKLKDKEEVERHFSNLAENVGRGLSSAEILRDVALSFEKSGDVHTAMKLMEKAHLLRPNGPVIKRKLDEYRALVNGK